MPFAMQSIRSSEGGAKVVPHAAADQGEESSTPLPIGEVHVAQDAAEDAAQSFPDGAEPSLETSPAVDPHDVVQEPAPARSDADGSSGPQCVENRAEQGGVEEQPGARIAPLDAPATSSQPEDEIAAQPMAKAKAKSKGWALMDEMKTLIGDRPVEEVLAEARAEVERVNASLAKGFEAEGEFESKLQEVNKEMEAAKQQIQEAVQHEAAAFGSFKLAKQAQFMARRAVVAANDNVSEAEEKASSVEAVKQVIAKYDVPLQEARATTEAADTAHKEATAKEREAAEDVSRALRAAREQAMDEDRRAAEGLKLGRQAALRHVLVVKSKAEALLKGIAKDGVARRLDRARQLHMALHGTGRKGQGRGAMLALTVPLPEEPVEAATGGDQMQAGEEEPAADDCGEPAPKVARLAEGAAEDIAKEQLPHEEAACSDALSAAGA